MVIAKLVNQCKNYGIKEMSSMVPELQWFFNLPTKPANRKSCVDLLTNIKCVIKETGLNIAFAGFCHHCVIKMQVP